MSLAIKPVLISFKLCPYVQRSVITLLEKGIEFDIEYIDVYTPPAWFLKISPTGRVPALSIGDEVLFESAVINEYLDETHPPSMHPADPLQRAQNRAWIEFASQLNVDQFQLTRAQDSTEFDARLSSLATNLSRLEQRHGGGPFFNGNAFSLADTSFAPFFMRLKLLAEHYQINLLTDYPKLRDWSAALLARDSVRRSVVDDFPALYHAWVEAAKGHITTRATK